jgi:hypothetical protein
MSTLAQNAFVNVVPLPPINTNADPNNILPTGAALSALDPNAPTAAQQPVGNAMDTVAGQDEPYDAIAAKLANGGSIRITSQAQFNALSESQKAVVRAGVATGGKLRAGDALRVYQDTLKQARANQVQTVSLPDGRTVYFANGQRIEADKQPEPVKREIRETADGLRAIDPLTGESFQVYDKYSGSAVTGKPKISEDNRVQFNQAHIELQRIQSELNQVNAIPTNKKVTQNDNGMWVPSDSFFGGENPEKVKARLLKDADYQSEKIRKIDPTNSVSAAAASQPAATPSPTPSATPFPSPTPSVTPSPTPSPTPPPNPMPTPDKFAVGKPYKDAKGNVKTYRGNGVWE